MKQLMAAAPFRLPPNAAYPPSFFFSASPKKLRRHTSQTRQVVFKASFGAITATNTNLSFKSRSRANASSSVSNSRAYGRCFTSSPHSPALDLTPTTQSRPDAPPETRSRRVSKATRTCQPCTVPTTENTARALLAGIARQAVCTTRTLLRKSRTPPSPPHLQTMQEPLHPLGVEQRRGARFACRHRVVVSGQQTELSTPDGTH